MDPRNTSIQSSTTNTNINDHKVKLLQDTMEEKTNVEFHLANSQDLDMDDINITIDNDNNTNNENETESINGENKDKDKKKSVRDDDVDYAAIARGLSSKQKKLRFSRLIKQSAPEKHILCLGVIFTFFGSLSALATPVLMGSMLDAVSSGSDAPSIEGRPTEIFCKVSPIGCDNEEGLLKTAVVTLFILAIFSAIFSFGKWFSLEIAGTIYIFYESNIRWNNVLGLLHDINRRESGGQIEETIICIYNGTRSWNV